MKKITKTAAFVILTSVIDYYRIEQTMWQIRSIKVSFRLYSNIAANDLKNCVITKFIWNYTDNFCGKWNGINSNIWIGTENKQLSRHAVFVFSSLSLSFSPPRIASLSRPLSLELCVRANVRAMTMKATSSFLCGPAAFVLN